MPPRQSLFLTGFMGAGKSTVGRLVAARAGVPFVDLDEVIEAMAGASIPALFATRGEAAFRQLEAEALDAALGRGPEVVALGGGALLDPARRRRALGRAWVVSLTASPKTLAVRTSGRGRPLLEEVVDREARIGDLLAARAAAYAEAHAVVETDTRSADEVAARIHALWQEPRVVVALGAESYAVRFAADPAAAVVDAAQFVAPTLTLLVTDENVGPRWAGSIEEALDRAGLRRAPRFTFPAGEEHKRLQQVERLLTHALASGADRGSIVLALGGGVVCDMAGFAAATLLRGVRWIAAPTTLLAMVDASVGGKTGVDLGVAKNAVGAFHHPRAVVIGAAYVATQHPRDYASGLAEVVKTALVGDADLLDLLEAQAERIIARDLELVAEVARRSVAVKAAIVTRDPREAGERAHLNLGHTLGHALEAEGGYRSLTHGEAVGLGTIAALRVGVALGVTSPDLPARISALLGRLGLPTRLDPARVEAALPLLGLDKKRSGAEVGAVLLRTPGDAFVRRTPLADLADAFRDAANFAAPPTPSLD